MVKKSHAREGQAAEVEISEPFHVDQVRTLAVSVQREIERQIFNGEITAGEKLVESTVARNLGISRGPVREAMRGLHQAGLVDIIANKGVVVRKIGLQEALDLYDLRRVLFAYMCGVLAHRRTDEHCGVLRGQMAEMHAAYADGDAEEYYRLNIAFHAAIVEFSGNDRARHVYQDVAKGMHLFRRRGLAPVENIAESLHEHEALTAAIIAGDSAAAERIGNIHISNGKQRFMATLEDHPEHAKAGG